MANTTWNPADKSANITLSNSDLTATSTSATAGGVRAVTGKRLGKLYVEFTCTALTGTTSAVGLGASFSTLTSLGASGSTIVVRTNGDIWVYGAVTSPLLNIGSVTAGAVICLAVDLPNKQAWFRKDGGSWNATSGSASDPTVHGTGVAFSGDGFYLVHGSAASGNIVTLNVGDSAFAQAVPSGYTSGWDDVSSIGTQAWGSLNTVNTGVPYTLPPVAAAPTGGAIFAPFRSSAAYPGTFSFSGTVLEAGLPVARLVRAYRRDTGELVGQTTSAGDGTFSLSTGSAANKECYVVAVDDTGTLPVLNAQIFDQVTGV